MTIYQDDTALRFAHEQIRHPTTLLLRYLHIHTLYIHDTLLVYSVGYIVPLAYCYTCHVAIINIL